jgi:type IV secretory pathway VirD2 relaxase
MATSDSRSATFRPRIGGRKGQIKPERVPTFRCTMIAKIEQRIRRITGGERGATPRRGRRPAAGGYGTHPTAMSRRCIVKARIVPMAGSGIRAARLHLSYIEREGVERDGSKGELYGAEGGTFRPENLAQKLSKEAHQFRFIVSPEDGAELDLRLYTRELMKQVEADLGRRIVWGAVNHHDTDNPHVHVVVRGVDVKGRPLRFDPAYISKGMRWRAQEIATRELGPREVSDLDRQRDSEVQKERLTSLDRDLARVASDTGQIGLVELAAAVKPKEQARLVGRLAVLEELGLAEQTRPGGWRLDEGWQSALKELGERGDIIKRIHGALPQPGDGSRYLVIDGKSEIEPIEGILRRKGLHDELHADMYAVVEDAHGQAHYVPLDAAAAQRLKEGAIVRAGVKKEPWAKPMDAVLEKVASENGGIYDPQRHLRSLESRSVVAGGVSVTPDAVVEANVRRLQRLARHALVAELPDGRWQVPTDLVSQLKARETTHPRLRAQVDEIAPPLGDQVKFRGPAWLDSVEPRAVYGFGDEVARAKEQRALHLEQLAIKGSASEVRRSLDAMARADAGRNFAEARGLAFVAAPPPGFHGVLVPCPGSTPDSNSGYVAILDERRRQFTVVADQAGLDRYRGRTVELTLGEDGALLVRRRELSRER